jgi:hypothetical protein
VRVLGKVRPAATPAGSTAAVSAELRTVAGESATSVGYRRTAALNALSDERIAMCRGVGLAGGAPPPRGLASIEAAPPATLDAVRARWRAASHRDG